MSQNLEVYRVSRVDQGSRMDEIVLKSSERKQQQQCSQSLMMNADDVEDLAVVVSEMKEGRCLRE